MKKLYLLRHAHAVAGVKDKERPLSDQGHKQMKCLRKNHKDLFKTIDIILCSSSVRTRETLEGLKGCLKDRVTIVYIDALYACTPQTILAEVSLIESKFQSILVIGHNPEFSDFLNLVSLNDPISMAKAEIAEFSLHKESWHNINYADLKFVKIIK